VPIYIGASGPAAAKLAGRLAEGFICTSGKGMELYRDTLLPAVREGAEAAARDCLARVAYKMPFRCRFVTRRPTVG